MTADALTVVRADAEADADDAVIDPMPDQERDLADVLALTAAVIGDDADISARWGRDWDQDSGQRTRELRARMVRDFARWWTSQGASPRLAARWEQEPWRALAALASIGPLRANLLVARYRGWMLEQVSILRDGTARRRYGVSAINGALSALRAATRKARDWGLINWQLTVKGLRRGPLLRDTRGPGTSGVQSLLRTTAGGRPKDLRDQAILRLLWATALRRAELVALAYPEDVDLDPDRGARIHVTGKGQDAKEWIAVPRRAAAALRRYIDEVRGDESGPLLYSMDRRATRTGITADGVYRMVRERGERAGIVARVRPHGIRHAAVTEAYHRHGLVGAQVFARHRSPTTTRAYIDVSDDLAGVVGADIEAELDAGL